MNIGYACLTKGIPNTQMRSCIMKNASPEKLYELIEHNLNSLGNILTFNAQNGIKLFRISSDIIPFGSSPVNILNWWTVFAKKFDELSRIINENQIRVSMHPGQYTVLNSPNPDVVSRAKKDLLYHSRVLDSLKTTSASKIILHIGGVYGDKQCAIKRFESVYKSLNEKVKARLVIENDDKSYNIEEVLLIGSKLNIPVIYDNLHNEKNNVESFDDSYWIAKCKETWKKPDGAQKIHYSQQAIGKLKGAHSETIEVRKFAEFIECLPERMIDIMLEVKDKNISALKCINAIIRPDATAPLLLDWERYKYKIIELSPKYYKFIEKMISSEELQPLEFYEAIEAAFKAAPDKKAKKLAAKTIWHDFFIDSHKKDKELMEQNLILYENDKISYRKIVKFLWEMVNRENIQGICNSFYFHLID